MCTIFGTSGLANAITNDNFFWQWLGSFDFVDSVRGRIMPFSYLLAVPVNTVLVLLRSL